jgi:hypothetical protein
VPRLTRNSEHLPEDCGDDDCPRYGCVMFRKGFLAGYRSGYQDGWTEGYAEGLAARPPLIVYVPAGK